MKIFLALALGLLTGSYAVGETDAYAVYKDDATYIYDYYEGAYYDNDLAAVFYDTDDDWFYDYYYLREDVENVDYDYDYFDEEYDWEVEYDWE